MVSSSLSWPNTTVIAIVRDTEKTDLTKPLTTLPVGASSKLILIELESTKDSDYPAAIENLETNYGISHIDVVIASAGVNTDFGPVESTSIDTVKDHISHCEGRFLRMYGGVLYTV